MKIRAILVSGAALVTLSGCGNAKEDEAERLGFSSVYEMERVHSKGWHTNAQYTSDETERAKRLGFIDMDELHAAEAAGIVDPKAYRKYKAKEDAKFEAEEAARERQAEASDPHSETDKSSSETSTSHSSPPKTNPAKLTLLNDSQKYCSSIDRISGTYSRLVARKIGVNSNDISFIGAVYGSVKGLNLCSVNLSTPLGNKKCSVSEIYSSNGGETSTAFPSDNEIKFDYILCE
jgi:hypothetical protein